MNPDLYISQSISNASSSSKTSSATASATSSGTSYYRKLKELQLEVDTISRNDAINLVTTNSDNAEINCSTINYSYNPIELSLNGVLSAYGYNNQL
jgi:hypothetical protein